MVKEKNHSAVYKLQRFLLSSKVHEFNLDPYDGMILFVVASYLDMPQGKCFGKQETLAPASLMSRKEFQRRTLKLHQLGLIMRYRKGKLYHYELGSEITGIEEEVESVYWTHTSSENGVQKTHKRPIDA